MSKGEDRVLAIARRGLSSKCGCLHWRNNETANSAVHNYCDGSRGAS